METEEISLDSCSKNLEKGKNDSSTSESKINEKLLSDVSKYVNAIHQNTENDIKRGLLGIKNAVIKDDNTLNVLLQCDGFRHLIKLLSSNNEKYLGMVLYILLLCWSKMSQTSLKIEFLNLGIVQKLSEMINKTTDVNSQKRALKLITVLSQCQISAKYFQNSDIAKATTILLSSTKSEEVQISSVRALRWMWSAEKHHWKLLGCGAVKLVASFLNSSNSEFLGRVLRALVVFTNTCTIAAAQQVTGSGDGYPQIVSKVGKPVISVLICNLSRSPVGRIELTRAGVVPEIINQLASGKNDKYLIMALCHMCQESMVRASLRTTPNGFQTLLSLIRNKNAQQYQSDLLYAITYFNYDMQSLSMMISVGLVRVLIEKLHDVASELGTVHSPSPPPPQQSGEMDATPSELQPLQSTSSDITSDPTIINYFDSMKKKRRESETMGECPSQDSCILEVLLQLTYHYNPLKILSLRKTVDTILRYLTTVEMPKQEMNFVRATKTLSAIVSCKHYFIDLMEEESIMSIHRELCIKRHSSCVHCDKLSETGMYVLNEMASSAESALGEGEMAHKLTSGSSSVKTIVALTIPLVIRQPHLLYSLLLVHNGLDCLIKSLDSHIDDAVPAIFTLMRTVGVVNPQKPQRMCCQPCEPQENKEDHNIMFELDDGAKVSANKEKLCDKYPMFEAMFRGGFKEAAATTVKLTDLSADCLRHMVRLSYSHCHCNLPSDVAVLLEMIVASDRFLLPTLSQSIVSHVIHNVLSHETSPEIYSWSLHTGYKLPFSSSMAVITIKYLFTANMFFRDRISAVKNIISGPDRENLISDLTSLIISGVKYYSVKFKSRYLLDMPHVF